MEKHPHPFDDSLKEALKGHQLVPPVKAREAFLKEASAIIPGRKIWNNWYYLPLLIVLISGIVAVFYYQGKDKPLIAEQAVTDNASLSADSSLFTSAETAESVSKPGSDSPSISTSTPTSSSNSTQSPVLDPKHTSTIESGSGISEKIAKGGPDGDLSTVRNRGLEKDISGDISLPETAIIGLSKNPQASDQAVQLKPGNQGQLLSQTTSSLLVLDSTGINTQKPDTVEIAQIILSDTVTAMPSADDPKTKEPGWVKPASYFTAGIWYLPEWMFNTYEGDKFINTFGIEGAYHYGAYSIRAGAGVSVFNGIEKLGVEYNDYLGTYNKLDSITFIFNEAGHDFVPDYHMSSEKVWDTILQMEYPEILKKYTFVRFPLAFGYDFLQKGRFSMGVRLGATLSLLLSSKQVSDDYDPGENNVVNVYPLTPSYVNLSWQFTGGLNASVRLAKNIYFEIEPMAKYYYKSVSEDPGSKKDTFSVGVRTAVIYKF